jgi:hypothetical protein
MSDAVGAPLSADAWLELSNKIKGGRCYLNAGHICPSARFKQKTNGEYSYENNQLTHQTLIFGILTKIMDGALSMEPSDEMINKANRAKNTIQTPQSSTENRGNGNRGNENRGNENFGNSDIENRKTKDDYEGWGMEGENTTKYSCSGQDRSTTSEKEEYLKMYENYAREPPCVSHDTLLFWIMVRCDPRSALLVNTQSSMENQRRLLDFKKKVQLECLRMNNSNSKDEETLLRCIYTQNYDSFFTQECVVEGEILGLFLAEELIKAPIVLFFRNHPWKKVYGFSRNEKRGPLTCLEENGRFFRLCDAK